MTCPKLTFIGCIFCEVAHDVACRGQFARHPGHRRQRHRLAVVGAILHRDRAGRPGTAPRRRLGAGRQLPVLRRARSLLPAHGEERRPQPFRAVRHRTGGSRVRAERVAARPRSRAGRGHGAEPRPLGPCRRHAARAAARARPQRRQARRLLRPSRHVPQPRRQDAGRLLPADGGRALAGRPRRPGRPRRLHARAADSSPTPCS